MNNEIHFCEHIDKGEIWEHQCPEDCKYTVCGFCENDEKVCCFCHKTIKKNEMRVYDGDAPCHESCFLELFGDSLSESP